MSSPPNARLHFPRNSDPSLEALLEEVFDDESAIVFAFETGILPAAQECSHCAAPMDLRDGVVFVDPFHWRCARSLPQCLTKSLRANSFVSNSLFSMRTVVLVVYAWFFGKTACEISEIAGVNRQSAENWTLLFRSVCRRFVETNRPKTLRGEVEVGVFNSRRHRHSEGKRVLVAVQRASPDPPLILVVEAGADCTDELRGFVAAGSRIYAKDAAKFVNEEVLREEGREVEYCSAATDKSPLIDSASGTLFVDELLAEVRKMGNRSMHDHLKFFEVVYRRHSTRRFRDFIELLNDYKASH